VTDPTQPPQSIGFINSPCIHTHTHTHTHTIFSSGGPLEYHILLILTDGICNDLSECVRSIVRASHLPLSIIIVGIGSGTGGSGDANSGACKGVGVGLGFFSADQLGFFGFFFFFFFKKKKKN
jgi:hypothetical protein